MEIVIFVGLLLLVALLFLATVDMAFGTLSDLSLRRLSAEAEDTNREKSARFLREIVEDRPGFRFTLSSAIQIISISFAVLSTLIVVGWLELEHFRLLVALIIAVAATIIFRQILPRLIVKNNPEGKLLILLPVVRPLYRAASLIVRPFPGIFGSGTEPKKVESTVTPDTPDEKSDETSADDFEALMDVGQAEGIIEDKERELILTMVEFNETRAGEIMTPRTEISALPIDATVRAARDIIIDQKYSRLPVYRDNIDNIEGVIYVRDLLQAWADGREDQAIRDILRDPFFVPETKSAAELLRNMQVNHVQMAIVIDEYGGVAGVVTVEDIVEEIVGEIEDEDTEEEEIVEIIEGGDGYFDVLGSTEIHKIERLFDIDLEKEDDEFTTIAGLVTNEAGYVPEVGEKLSLRGLDFEILAADEKKVTLIRIRQYNPDDNAVEAVQTDIETI